MNGVSHAEYHGCISHMVLSYCVGCPTCRGQMDGNKRNNFNDFALAP